MFPGHMLGRKVVFSARIQATGQESCSTLPSKSIPHEEKEKFFWWHILNSLELRILCTILVKYTTEMTSMFKPQVELQDVS